MYQEMRPEPSLLRRFAARLDELLLQKDFEMCEVVSGLAALAWALVLLMPWDTFGSASGFSLLDEYVPEWLAGVFMLWVAITQLGTLVLDHRAPRRWACLLITGLWAGLAVILAAGNPYGIGFALHLLFALCSAWAYLRIGRMA